MKDKDNNQITVILSTYAVGMKESCLTKEEKCMYFLLSIKLNEKELQLYQAFALYFFQNKTVKYCV